MSSRVNSLKLARRVRRGWRAEMTRRGVTRQHAGRDGKTATLTPGLARLRLTEWGVTGRLNLVPFGIPIGEFAKRHRSGLETTFEADCTIRQTSHGRARVEFRHTDPLARPLGVDDLPAPRRRLHVVTRIGEDGTGVEQDVILPRLVIGGQGSGKSTELWTFLWALHRAGIPVRLRVFDPKGGMELGELRPAAHVYETRPHGWGQFIADALAALNARQRSLAKRGIRNLNRFTDAEPLDLLVIDELLTVVTQKGAPAGKSGLTAGEAHEVFLSQARAAGFCECALTQIPQKVVLGNARALFPHITMLRVPPSEREMSDRLLGPDHPAHEIPPGLAGVGYTRTPQGGLVRSRGAMLTDRQRTELIEALTGERRRQDQAKQQRRQRRQDQQERERAGAAA